MLPTNNILKAKLHAPQIPTDFVVRKNVNEKLKGKKETSVFLFSAPSGYGKTTSAINWLQSRGVTYGWLSLDEHDNVLKAFLKYIVLAIRGVVPKFGAEIEHIISSNQELSTRDYQILLNNEVRGLQEVVYLVLDDYHFIRNQEIHDTLIHLFKFSQPKLKLVITTRKDPPFPLSDWRMKNRLTEIRARDLTFDFSEINQFFHNQQIDTPLHDFINRIEQVTEGWITGLRLLTVSGINANQDKNVALGASPKNVTVLLELVKDMLRNQEPEVCEGILKMSIVDEFNKELYQLILNSEDEHEETPYPGFEKFVNLLLRSNLFLITLDDRHNWFRFHHLFLELLRKTCLNEFSKNEIQDIYSKLASWYGENDQVVKSIGLLLKLGQNSEAIDIFEKYRSTLFENSEWQLLEEILLLFDDSTINESLVLNLSSAWLYVYKGDIGKMMSLLPDLEQKCLESGLMKGKQGHYLGEINTLKAYARYNFDIDMKVALEHATTALALLSSNNLYATGVAWVFYGGALQALGKSHIARREILATLDGSVSSAVRSNLYLILCYIHWMDGNIGELSAVSSALINLGCSNDLKEAEANGFYFSGCAKFSRNNRDEALRDFSRLYDLRHYTIMVHRFFGSAALTFLLLDRDNEKLTDLLMEMRLNAMERGGIHYVSLVQAISASVNWIRSKSPESLKWAMETPHLPMLPMTNFTSIPMLQSYILASSGNKIHATKAMEILDDCQKFLQKLHNLNFLTQTYVLKTLALLNLGKPEKARKEFRSALKLAVPRGLSSTFLALEDNVLSDFMQSMSLLASEKNFLEEILNYLRPSNETLNPILSRREKEVLDQMHMDISYKQIAENLFISESTVKRHIANIFSKLDVHSRNAAIEKAKALTL